MPADRAARLRPDRRRVRHRDRDRAAVARDRRGCVRGPRDGRRRSARLGGIGKGYAVDLVAELLEEWGLERAFVHGGFSSAVALEPQAASDGWPLTLSDPREPSRVFCRLSMRQAALSASGVRKGDHILDPRTGDPVRGRLAAWVALPRPAQPGATAADGPRLGPRLAPAAVADALTTAFMLLGVDEIRRVVRAQPRSRGVGASRRRIRGNGGRAALRRSGW